MAKTRQSCYRCNGIGKVGSVFYPEDCPVCEGTRHVLVDSDAVPCPDCESTGISKRETVWGPQPCPKCKGTGWRTPPAR